MENVNSGPVKPKDRSAYRGKKKDLADAAPPPKLESGAHSPQQQHHHQPAPAKGDGVPSGKKRAASSPLEEEDRPAKVVRGENKNRELKKQLSASNRKVERLEEELEEVKLELEEEREEKQALKDEIEYLSNELEETHRSEEVTRVCLVCQEDGHDPSDYNYI